MQFTKRLHPGIRSGRITQSIRIWKSARVKVGSLYPLAPGHIRIDAVTQIDRDDITEALALACGFDSLADQLAVAQHGSGNTVFLIDFTWLDEWA